MLHVSFHPTAEKELVRIPTSDQEAVATKLKELRKLNHPLQHRKVKKLKGGKEERFRLRTGDYRIKFTFRKPDTVFVTRIEHRQAGY